MSPDMVKRKVILIGDGAVGKTSLIRRFVLEKFDDRYITTIGTKVSKKEIVVSSKGSDVSMTLMVWDILGQQGYTAIQRAGYRGSEGAILVCDYTRRETLESLEKYWIPELRGVVGEIPMVIAGNKADLVDKRMFSETDIKALADKSGSPFISTSALTGDHVEEMFLDLGKMMMGTFEKKKDDQFIHAEQKESMSLMEVTDWLMGDFCDKFGGVDNAMPVLRKQFDRAGVDVKQPSREGLYLVIEYLAEVEAGFKPKQEVMDNKNRRRRAVSSSREG
ncbi:MAG: GTP-binding protein [Candidatus Thermoplasmatota archaeon]|nr:GTP-binding protein [Candidatus Thermoplasmatota archaeon]